MTASESSVQPVTPQHSLPHDGSYRFLAAGIALLAIGVRGWLAFSTHSTAEDFLITLRYAENLAGGQGFVYNPGEHVLGTTTPLYTLFLAVCTRLHLDAAGCGKTLNILADGLTCYLLARLPARQSIRLPVVGLFAALLYALGSTPLSISIGGMETALVTCAGLGAILAFLDGKARLLCVLCAVLLLLRPDTLLLAGCLLVPFCLRTRLLPLREFALAILIVLPWLIFACVYFGSPIPTSIVAKLIVYAHPQMAGRDAIIGPFRAQFVAGAAQLLLTLLAVLGAGRVLRHPRWQLTAPLVWLLLYYGTMLASHVPAFGWYFLPPWPLFLLLAMTGANGILARLAKLLPAKVLQPFFNALDHASNTPTSSTFERLNTQAPTPNTEYPTPLSDLWKPALILLCVWGLFHLRSVRADVAGAQELEDAVRRPVGVWLRAHVRPTERVLLEPIGTIGYYSHARMLDMIGLVSPEVFPSYRTNAPLADITRRLHPEWLCLRPSEVPRLIAGDARLLERDYKQMQDFRASDGRLAFVIYRRKQDSSPPVSQ